MADYGACGRVLLLIMEGVADISWESLGGGTPLQAASTPVLDSLAAGGSGGLVYSVSPGAWVPGDLALWHLFGYGLLPFPGRAVLEAMGSGVELAPGDVVTRVDLASTAPEEGELYVQVPSVGMSEEERERLFGSLSEYSGGRFRTRLFPIGGSSMALVLSGGASPEVTDSDPVFYRLPAGAVEPLEGHPEAAETARELREFSRWAGEVLEAHPVTRERELEYMTRANDVLLKWTGLFDEIPDFQELWGFRGFVAASSPAVLGMARAAGMETERTRGDEPSVDLKTKLAAALDALATDYDFAVVHTDELSMPVAGKPSRKVDLIERLDSALDTPLSVLERAGGCVVAVAAIPGSRLGASPALECECSQEPVPLIVKGGCRTDGVDRFDEVALASGGLGTLRGKDLMPLLLSATGRTRPETARLEPKNRKHRPLPGLNRR